ncbi:methyltransferase domain-containing protein [bacterium]|nr:methyltransferase domain-containing protein [bacterium]
MSPKFFVLAQGLIFGACMETQVNWFGSEYYLKLYRNRNLEEAKAFIDNLLGYLNPASGSRFIDVCCGRGRHAIYLAEKGYVVTGIDSSVESIAEAQKVCKPNLSFKVGDIRKPLQLEPADVALNLFTSFGYFDSDEENLLSMQNIAGSLRKGGSLVIDYLNEHSTAQNLQCCDDLEIDGIQYALDRVADEHFIRKTIEINDKGKKLVFHEQVRRYGLSHFNGLFKAAGLQLQAVFGNYQLAPFELETSDRLIMHAKKL